MAIYSTKGQFGGYFSNPQFGQGQDWYKKLMGQAGIGSVSAPQSMYSAPGAAIEAAKPAITEQMNNNFAAAGQKFGNAGMGTSTPYAQALGGAARGASNDFASLAANLQYDAANQAANRQLQAYGLEGGWNQADRDRAMQGLVQQGNWNEQGMNRGLDWNIANLQDATQRFGLEGGWNQMGLDRAQNMTLAEMQDALSRYGLEGSWNQQGLDRELSKYGLEGGWKQADLARQWQSGENQQDRSQQMSLAQLQDQLSRFGLTGGFE